MDRILVGGIRAEKGEADRWTVPEIGRVTGEPMGGTWMPDNSLIVATNDPRTGLIQVPAEGGTPTVLSNPGDGERDHQYPSALPGGRAVLFTIGSVGPAENSQVAALDLNTHQRKILFRGGSDARYVETGQLVYAASGTLRVVRFDPALQEVRGVSVPVIDNVGMTNQGAAAFSVSKDGTLVYVQAAYRDGAKRTLVWVDQKGRRSLSARRRSRIHIRVCRRTAHGSPSTVAVRTAISGSLILAARRSRS